MTFIFTGSKEAGFAISIKSAGIAHSIVQSCSHGTLNGCKCNEAERAGEQSVPDWTWAGCSANIEYGIHFARIFLDAADNGDTPRSLMNLHNSRAGRKVRDVVPSMIYIVNTSVFHLMILYRPTATHCLTSATVS